MKTIKTEIIINSSSEQVWQQLTDFNSYSQWNPFVHIKGQAHKGAQLENTMFIEGQKPQIFKPVITAFNNGRSFRWLGVLLIKGLFDGEHYFELEKIEVNKTRLIHGENFRGIFTNMIMNMIGEKTKKGFEKMNRALKERCEAFQMSGTIGV